MTRHATPGAGYDHSSLFPSGTTNSAPGVPNFRIKPILITPSAAAAEPDPVDLPAALQGAIETLRGRRVTVLTGAGISTDSDMPDYRSPGAPPRQPMTYQQFRADEEFRRHYWARNHMGWRHLLEVTPNAGHRALAQLADCGVVNGVITQNIDLLHVRAGSPSVVHLHGRFDRVSCLNCQRVYSRQQVDDWLTDRNPGWREQRDEVTDIEIAPDADAALEETSDFQLVDCPYCGGILVPDIVFFGSNTPRSRVDHARQLLSKADALLVAGSSLAVMSGLRFVRQATKAGQPVVIINRGPTRGNELADAHVSAGTSESLPLLVEALC